MFSDMKDDYEALSQKIAQLAQGDAKKSDIDSFVEETEKFEQKRNIMKKIFGLTDKDQEAMGIGDVVADAVDMMPKVGEGIRSIADAFNTRSVDDDIPAPMPNYSMPQRNIPTQATQTDPRIEMFLAKCSEDKGQLVDTEGIPWTTIDGKPLSKQDIRELSVIDPDTILDRINQVKALPPKKIKPAAPEQEEKTPEPKKVEPETPEPAKGRKKPEEQKKRQKEEDRREQEREEPQENSEEEIDADESLLKAQAYIDSLKEGAVDETNTGLVGPEGEIYTMEDENGEMIPIKDRKMLIEEAEADPQNFLAIVKQAQHNAREQREEQNAKAQNE